MAPLDRVVPVPVPKLTPTPLTSLKRVTPAPVDAVVPKAVRSGQAAAHVPFFKPAHLAKVGLGGMLLDVPFVGWSYKDGEISSKQVVGKLAASPLNWIAFEGAMRLPARWLPQLKGSPLGMAAGLAAGMLASGLYEKYVGHRIADAVASVTPESIANPIAETTGTIAEYLDNTLWEPGLAKVVRPAMDAAMKHPWAAAGIGLTTSALLHRPMPKTAGFVLGNVTGIAGMVGVQHLPGGHRETTGSVPPVPPYVPTATTLQPAEAQGLFASGRTSAVIDQGGHRLLTNPQQVDLIKRLSGGITSGASEKRIMRILKDSAADGRLDALLQGLNKSKVSGTMVGSLLDMRKADVLSLVADTSGVSGTTAREFLSQVRPADIKEIAGMPASAYTGYVGLLQDLRTGKAADLEADTTAWPGIIGSLSLDQAGAICSEALVRTDLRIPTKLLVLESLRPDVAKDLDASTAIAMLRQAQAAAD